MAETAADSQLADAEKSSTITNLPDRSVPKSTTGDAKIESGKSEELPHHEHQEKLGKPQKQPEQSKQAKQPKPPKPPKLPKEPKVVANNAPKGANKKSGAKGDAESSGPLDPDAMFKVGFLAEVYQERPIAANGIQKVVTRFPPEPNGFLHIGHSKAIAVNFGFAKYHGGECYLRLDDTNPEEEEKMYETSIIETVKWLGFEPKAVTYSSDHFQRLYDLAEDLIKKDKAYVCYCSRPEIIEQRGGGAGKRPRYACPHRDRPQDESLTEFRRMKSGQYKPNTASLRMKQNLEDGNPQMWDLVAYRIPKRKDQTEAAEEDANEEDEHDGVTTSDGKDGKDGESEDGFAKPHYRTGDTWKVYPSYDFCHCLCDSFEGITHSLCTVEFEQSRVSYEWLNNQLVEFKPMQREYGRLNVTSTVLSKRKINKLVKAGYVTGSDDPRLYTLMGLRRRGVPPGAILSFVNELGVTKATSNIQTKRFEASIRKYLEITVPRLMIVLDPIKVIIDDLPDDHFEMCDSPFAKDPAVGTHSIPFTKTVYIERSDFREHDSPDYFRLAPGKTVGLMKAPFPITATTIDKDPATGAITAVHAKYERPADGSAPKKPKSWIHWVSASCSTHQKTSVQVSVRIINALFLSENPDSAPGGFMHDINPDSLITYPNAMIEIGFDEIYRRAPWPAQAGEKTGSGTTLGDGGKIQPETVRFQGMRMGYFCVDKDSTPDNVVLNRIVSLKEDAGKL